MGGGLELPRLLPFVIREVGRTRAITCGDSPALPRSDSPPHKCGPVVEADRGLNLSHPRDKLPIAKHLHRPMIQDRFGSAGPREHQWLHGAAGRPRHRAGHGRTRSEPGKGGGGGRARCGAPVWAIFAFCRAVSCFFRAWERYTDPVPGVSGWQRTSPGGTSSNRKPALT